MNLDRLLMLSFKGLTMPGHVHETLQNRDVSGFTLFRDNTESPEQVRALSDSLQASRSTEVPLLIAIDQEGGQLHALGSPATLWSGNMALGAVDDAGLTQQVGAAIGRELRAVGVNVDYAPVADLNTNPDNPATGIRAFGDDPDHVSRHVAAMVTGIQSQGVAATMKHFPGKGDSSIDSHHGMPLLDHTMERLRTTEFLPFAAAIDAGVKLAMTGHFALPSLTGSDDLPCTLAWEANTGLLRHDLGFRGALITDALDMNALEQGEAQIVDIIAAVASGVDLLLLTADPVQEERSTTALALALSRRLVTPDRLAEANERVMTLRSWTSESTSPDLNAVGSAPHHALRDEVARRSMTLLRDDSGLIPLQIDTTTRIVVIETEPTNLTPADTSEHETPRLALELAEASDAVVTSMIVPHCPSTSEISGAIAIARTADIVVIGTVSASMCDEQAALVKAINGSATDVVVVALRTPYDIIAFPDITTYLCAWSINPANARAAARALLGLAPVTGRTPVTIGSYPLGSGMDRP